MICHRLELIIEWGVSEKPIIKKSKIVVLIISV